MRQLLKSKINSAINSFSKLGEKDLISDILTSTNIIVKALKSKKIIFVVTVVQLQIVNTYLLN